MRDKFIGGLLGCAIGDALGAAYEGVWSESIPEKHILLREFSHFEGYPQGQYTDDTQLTIATIESIVQHREISAYLIAKSMFALWKTQAVVGPGGACTQAADRFLASDNPNTCGADKGSAGNGTAMRTALLGLAFCNTPQKLATTVAQISRLTHRDMRSIAGGIAIAKAAHINATHNDICPNTFCHEIATCIEDYHRDFANLIANLPQYLEREDEETLNFICYSGMPQPEFSAPIITPFVIPTVLAALWCFLRHKNCWSQAVYRAIKFGGDVDTLGAITGALSGIYLGQQAIPIHLRNKVYRSNYLKNLAGEYHNICSSPHGVVV